MVGQEQQGQRPDCLARWQRCARKLDYSQCGRSYRRRTTLDGHSREGNQGMSNQGQKNTAAMTADKWYKQAVSRSNCYGLLALVFRDTPTTEIVSQLRTPPLADILVRLGYDIVQNLAGELEPVPRLLRRVPFAHRDRLAIDAAPGVQALPRRTDRQRPSRTPLSIPR